ncbi:hypothetical protein G5I_11267 [Acromyrmex echinatior]|uniref:Uncharacterized protein n=1 Tax=Acromyrmex echinatior TaxID=103372 RepID=F4WZ53_ACREC|nr:hypothetical protein G5I_11267 [Acromyrmex echinatior]
MEIGTNLRRQVSWQSRERYSEKGESAERRTEQNAVCVFRIKGRPIVDFPGRYLSDSSRHSWRHLRFSILRKRTRPLDTYYALRSSSSSPSSSPLYSVFSTDIHAVATFCLYLQRIKSFTSCAELEKSNEAFVGSTNGVSSPESVTNAIRKSTRWYPKDYPRNRVQGGPIAASGTGIALLFAGEGTMQKIQITIEAAKEALVKSVDDTTAHFISN